MKSRLVSLCTFLSAISLLALAVDPLIAERIELLGPLGNSGIAGEKLLRTEVRNGSGGVYLDPQNMTVWLSGGDAILQTTFNGRLKERYPLGPCQQVDTTAFAALEGTLYFTGETEKRNPETRSREALFALPMRPGTKVRLVKRFRRQPALAAQPMDGKLLLGPHTYNEKGQPLEAVVTRFDPQSGDQKTLFSLGEGDIRGLAYDHGDDVIYLGGHFGKYVAARKHHPRVCEVIKCDRTGRELRRTTMFRMTAIPSQFKGWLSFAEGAVWPTAWYGFVGRMNARLHPAPGKVMGWNLELHHGSQFLGVRDVLADQLLPPQSHSVRYDPLLMARRLPEAYFGRWNPAASRLELIRRIGALPEVGGLALSENGWISVGTEPKQTWWRWSDPPEAAPRFGNNGHAITQGAFRENRMASFLKHPRRGIRAAFFTPSTSRKSMQATGPVPFEAKGFAVGADGSTAYATGPSQQNSRGRLWRGQMSGHNWLAQKGSWQAIEVHGKLADPGNLVALPNDRLLTTDGSALVMLQRAGKQTFEVAWRWRRWGSGEMQRFGSQLFLGGDGRNVVVADGQRHRLLWIDPEKRSLRAQFGRTDVAGSDLDHLNRPSHLDVAGNRVVVYDAGNQRLCRFLLRP